jgi:hypothetical protein
LDDIVKGRASIAIPCQVLHDATPGIHDTTSAIEDNQDTSVSPRSQRRKYELTPAILSSRLAPPPSGMYSVHPLFPLLRRYSWYSHHRAPPAGLPSHIARYAFGNPLSAVPPSIGGSDHVDFEP